MENLHEFLNLGAKGTLRYKTDFSCDGRKISSCPSLPSGLQLSLTFSRTLSISDRQGPIQHSKERKPWESKAQQIPCHTRVETLRDSELDLEAAVSRSPHLFACMCGLWCRGKLSGQEVSSDGTTQIR
jgi:hypothetical protein